MNWKEQLAEEYQELTWNFNGHDRTIQDFISSEIIEKLIEDMNQEVTRISKQHGLSSCDRETDCDVALDDVSHEIQQLRDKWL